MSKILTFEQSKRLQALGISIVSDCGYVGYTKSGELVSRRKFKEDREYQTIPCWIRVFTVSEALDWIREKKGIDCCVFFNNELFGNLDNAKAIYYFKYGCNGRMIYNSWNVDYKSFDTHSLAESALLDAVLTYLEKK